MASGDGGRAAAVITYVDTSVLLKLLVDDELGTGAAERLWVESEFVICAEIAYTEARAALASVHRSARLSAPDLVIAKSEFEHLWEQIEVVPITAAIVRSAGDLAERQHLRGYDAIHLAAALAAEVSVFATADSRLLDAASRSGLATSNPSHSPLS